MRHFYLASVGFLLMGLLLPAVAEAHMLLNTAPAVQAAPAMVSQEGLRENKRVQRLTRKLKRKLDKFQRRWLSDLPEGCAKIVLKSGDIIEANIIQISPDAVTYKRCDKPDDPEIVVSKAEVLSVIAEDGGFLYRGKMSSARPAKDQGVDPLAIAAMSAAGGAFLFIFIWGILSILAALSALVMGIISRKRIRESGGKLRGKGLATTGIIAGGVILFLWLFATLVFVG